MSVPAYKRQKPDPNNPRDPEFVLLSKKLYVEVIDLLSCMSARYGRLIAVPTAELAGEVQDFAVKANDVFPSDQQKLTLRREYLLRCHAAARRWARGWTRCMKCCGPTRRAPSATARASR